MRAAAAVLVASLLPVIGFTSAGAKQTTKQPPATKDVNGLAERALKENLRALDAGQPMPKGGGRNDCDEVQKPANLKKLKDKGVDQVSCTRSTDPKTVDPSVLPDFLAKLDKQMAPAPDDIPPANFPAAAGDGEMQVNNLKPYDSVDATIHPASHACGPANVKVPEGRTHYNDRKDACLVYYFEHLIVKTGSAQVLGIGHFITVEWGALSAQSRTWDHKVALAMYMSDRLAINGIWTWLRIDTSGGAKIINQVPSDDGGKLLRTGEVYWGRATMSSFNIDPNNPFRTEYSRQSYVVVTFSVHGDNIAVGQPGVALSQVRCDSVNYIMHSGCVYGDVTGRFYLSRSDPNAKDSISFVERAQAMLPTHPGREPNYLTRATPAQNDANRAVSRAACAPLPKPGIAGTATAHDCDEYPFAATVQGAASGPRYVNWDIHVVLASHNRRVGGLLIAFYNGERMFWGDRFYVVIVP